MYHEKGVHAVIRVTKLRASFAKRRLPNLIFAARSCGRSPCYPFDIQAPSGRATIDISYGGTEWSCAVHRNLSFFYGVSTREVDHRCPRSFTSRATTRESSVQFLLRSGPVDKLQWMYKNVG